MTKPYLMLALLAVSMAAITPAAADVIATCAGCHGTEGTSSDKNLPIIGGMSSEYIKGTLAGYKSGDRNDCPQRTVSSGDKKGSKSDMCQVAKGLEDADMKTAADYYSAKPFVRARQTADDAMAKKGQVVFDQICEKCHSNNGTVKADDTSILAGQWMQYIHAQLDDFRHDKRKGPDKMVPKLKKLDQSEVDAIVQYLGSFK